ncbi:chromosome alignment-maintaining phosphoprotein 1-like [Fundulus heteroclitus]|uniref:chromosome alignment-maintaining phosphoprotein 1-like n=1 Tax=Fundulus heteroclitus TaxID=8078 RepID=UPI00165CE7E9|nr:chromosome alignment-maintaining phosphoprotein 1-like [Fundulus heteroclitus]
MIADRMSTLFCNCCNWRDVLGDQESGCFLDPPSTQQPIPPPFNVNHTPSQYKKTKLPNSQTNRVQTVVPQGTIPPVNPTPQAGPFAAEGAEIQPANAPQTDLPATSSQAPTARRGTPSLKRKRQLSSLVKLHSTTLRFQEAINKNLSRIIKARKIITETVESIQKIPLSARKGGFHSRKCSELLRSCKCLMDEIAKISTLQ